MLDFLHTNETAILWLAVLSLLTFCGSLVIVPVLVIKIPGDYFSNSVRHRPPWARHHPMVRAALLVAKNLLGYTLILAGILMLVLPGQGLLTLFMGIMLLDFPGKYRFERWLVSRKPVLRPVNWIRKRAHRAPLTLDR
ncbi:MAG: hypothetical protein HY885_10545 [Deltaproteobacteria bacterium]|nr:hypothetical protein [Deltaproteobacteria bacterium]